MKKTLPLYQDYSEHPYISPTRNIALWIKHPEKFPYGVVPKKNMIRLVEGILPGELILLWRIHFNTFTTESIIPEYFEYRYGINSITSLDSLLEKGLIRLQNATQSVDLLPLSQLRPLLKKYNLPLQGNKPELLTTLLSTLSEETLKQEFSIRRYEITSSGLTILNNHPEIIQRHGAKK